jgi:hypothetical protein
MWFQKNPRSTDRLESFPSCPEAADKQPARPVRRSCQTPLACCANRMGKPIPGGPLPESLIDQAGPGLRGALRGDAAKLFPGKHLSPCAGWRKHRLSFDRT